VAAVDDGLAKLTRMLFGKELGPVVDYEGWLNERMDVGRVGKSCLTGKRVYIPSYAIFKSFLDERIAGLDSLRELSEKRVNVSGEMGLWDVAKKTQEIEYYIIEFSEGENLDVTDSALYQNLAHSYRTIDCWNSKYLAYDFFCDKCEYIYGCYRAFGCKFSIHCYNSKNLVRCFEMESCYNCSDSMFCHNCENVRESMFCSNVKNKKYAVMNVEVGPERYLKLKKMLVEGIAESLEKKKTFGVDVFNLGCFRKSNP
jgi:hypothetical protein